MDSTAADGQLVSAAATKLPADAEGPSNASADDEATALLDAAADFISLVRHNDVDTLRLGCLLYTSPSPRDGLLSRMPSSA